MNKKAEYEVLVRVLSWIAFALIAFGVIYGLFRIFRI